jgi:hypothetical protein
MIESARANFKSEDFSIFLYWLKILELESKETPRPTLAVKHNRHKSTTNRDNGLYTNLHFREKSKFGARLK